MSQTGHLNRNAGQDTYLGMEGVTFFTLITSIVPLLPFLTFTTIFCSSFLICHFLSPLLYLLLIMSTTSPIQISDFNFIFNQDIMLPASMMAKIDGIVDAIDTHILERKCSTTNLHLKPPPTARDWRGQRRFKGIDEFGSLNLIHRFFQVLFQWLVAQLATSSVGGECELAGQMDRKMNSSNVPHLSTHAFCHPKIRIYFLLSSSHFPS